MDEFMEYMLLFDEDEDEPTHERSGPGCGTWLLGIVLALIVMFVLSNLNG